MLRKITRQFFKKLIFDFVNLRCSFFLAHLKEKKSVFFKLLQERIKSVLQLCRYLLSICKEIAATWKIWWGPTWVLCICLKSCTFLELKYPALSIHQNWDVKIPLLVQPVANSKHHLGKFKNFGNFLAFFLLMYPKISQDSRERRGKGI